MPRETRAILKDLMEKRNAKLEAMQGLVDKATEEKRSFNEEENRKFSDLKAEIEDYDKTLKNINELRNLDKMEPVGDKEDKEENRSLEETRAQEERDFVEFVKTGENRAFKAGDNGSIIPEHIANKIIDKVKELSPIYKMVTTFNVGGNLSFPVYDESEDRIQAGYVEELEEVLEHNGKFVVKTLENNIVGALTKVSKSLINRTDLNILPFIINKMAEAFLEFFEKELITGVAKAEGLATVGASQQVTAAAATAITADDLIDLQTSIVTAYQGNASWIMHKDTFTAIKKLKNADGEYLLNKDLTTGFGWNILGKPVYITESMPNIAAGVMPVFYGDFSGLYMKFAQNLEIQILREKYATQHAIGIVGFTEFDAKIIETQKIAALKMAAA